MKKDGEIKLLLSERDKGASQKLAAARADVCERTARKYEQAGKLPSQMKKPRTHRTRDNPFVDDWSWVEAQIRDDPALQTKTLFALLCAQRSRAVTRKGSCARCNGMCRHGAFAMGRDRRSCSRRCTYPGAWRSPTSPR